MRYDADRGEGKAAAQRFSTNSFPTFLIVDANGRKLDEFVGHRTPEEFIRRLRQSAR